MKTLPFTTGYPGGDDGITRLDNILDGGEVQRFHTEGTVPCQSVAQHVFGVIAIATYISADVSPAFLLHCLLHDAEERFTGDVPFTAKRDLAESAALSEVLNTAESTARALHLWELPDLLTEKQECILKLADMLEGLRYARRYGHTQTVADRWCKALDEFFTSSRSKAILTSSELIKANRVLKKYRHHG